MRETFHLLPEEAWARADRPATYQPDSFASDGFIHCTDGIEALGDTFDRHYAADARPFLALTLDLDQVGVPWRYDVPGSPYPHIYGPIVRQAIAAVSRVDRAEDGSFAGLSPV
jgi:uncharacterized protein (DUF952 family)